MYSQVAPKETIIVYLVSQTRKLFHVEKTEKHAQLVIVDLSGQEPIRRLLRWTAFLPKIYDFGKAVRYGGLFRNAVAEKARDQAGRNRRYDQCAFKLSPVARRPAKRRHVFQSRDAGLGLCSFVRNETKRIAKEHVKLARQAFGRWNGLDFLAEKISGCSKRCNRRRDSSRGVATWISGHKSMRRR